ncbi:radical SAM protein [Rhodoplanes sp. TEM]|uniref:Radical SAM protein n=1 Tax=Rhodoplanes tepidamans TaxID=200616 RepID=A0ABT5JB31_RHOTP|nr:radical SAM protein [Rhodoplanes tepidamans]MDC7786857.1 radical SAM protein [Rhodoplanes tepidamans]MDC7984214.1 radical SAM protein [Rhodoplanes sp. TEM]MDQ0355985.1 MoaA/NifB/PqqE/SkfB family radical SAM enzyme [Rhodoplanes tepidamans]
MVFHFLKRMVSREAPAGGFDARLDPPRFLFLLINSRCNLKCEHCSFWHTDDADRANYLDRAGRRRVLSEFAAMNPHGAVVICGGESMLDLEDYFDVAGHCRALGLTCLSVVNGTRIRTDAMAERMVTEGPHEISISLNSHRPQLHDRTRGVPGAFDKACRAVRLLKAARDRTGSTSRIYVMGLIFDENHRELEPFYDFVLNDLKADKLKLNFLQPSFGDTPEDRFFAAHHRMDPDVLVEEIRRCDARFGLGLNPVWLANVRMYVESIAAGQQYEKGWAAPTRTRAHICNTYERNIMVDHYGTARLCFSTDFRGAKLRADGDLKRFWLGANDIRCEMRKCNRLCGISHSVRRIGSTLTPAAYSLPTRSLAGTAAAE